MATAAPGSSAAPANSAYEETDKWLRSRPALYAQLESMVVKLKRRQLHGPFRVAKSTVELLRAIVGTCRWNTAEQIMAHVRQIGLRLATAQPQELAVGNIVRRVLFVIREEYATKQREAEEEGAAPPEPPAPRARTESGTELEPPPTLTANAAGAGDQQGQGEGDQPSLQTLLAPAGTADFSTPYRDLKEGVMDGLNELISELEQTHEPISEQALEHIHANEVILTFSKSDTVIEFFKAAASKRRFSVIVAESAPLFGGHEVARELATAGIDTTVINDSAVFALMARVNKVIMPTHAVMANGGLLAESGGHLIALAAREHAVPVVVLTGLYKLSPLYAFDQATINDLASPSEVIPCGVAADVTVLNPRYDYIPPELVSLFITNFGGHQPSYVYRLLSEQYSPLDTSLEG